ncbi:MAG TPA: RraA family protein [Actinomycetota bacterium]
MQERIVDPTVHQPPFVHELAAPRPDPGVVAALREVSGLASAVSDELDARGLRGAVPATQAPPLLDVRVVGPALTLRYLPERLRPGRLAAEGSSGRLGNQALAAAARPGDVLVIDGDGTVGASLLGGVAAAEALRAGVVAALVDGAVRDVDEIVAAGLPTWAVARTPVTGRRRMEAVELNGWVAFRGAQVRPGDLVVADSSGICFVPPEVFGEIAAAVLGQSAPLAVPDQ